MLKTAIIVLVLAATAKLATAAAAAGDDPNLTVADKILHELLPGSEPTMAIWPAKAPDEDKPIPAEGTTGNGKTDKLRIQNVSRPTITVTRPKNVPANGSAVIVCPGGGYGMLAASHEGTDIVKWLNSHGVTGVLLKYRVPRRQKADDLKHVHALQDAQRAMGLVRLHAKDWGIDPDRVGILGFSAGGHLSATLCNNYDKRTYEPVDEADKLSCKPDFAVLIYPAYLKTTMGLGEIDKVDPLQHAESMSPKRTAPTFIALSENDPYAGSGIAYYIALAKAKVPAALHIYPGGKHGTGLQAYPLNKWGDEAAVWMRDLKIIAEKK
jgi:acetyl esterase/lipase